MSDLTAANTQVTSAREQILTLKVMRLSRPRLVECAPHVHIEPSDLCAVELTRALCAHAASTTTDDMCGFSVLLPQSFENIYLGETFTFYVCLQNDSEQVCTEVCIKADLQTTTQRLSLPNKYQEAEHELQPAMSMSTVISHEVKDIGQHILVCAVHYVTQDGVKMNFRKFFKFPVAKPLDVRTKFYNADSNEVFFEAQIENLTTSAICMERCTLDANVELYTVDEICVCSNGAANYRGTLADTDNDSSSLLPLCIAPRDVCQYLYRLTAIAPDERLYRGVTVIGKLDIVWRSAMGERGRLQTSPLQRMAPGCGDIRCIVTHCAWRAHVGDMVPVELRLTNCCVERPVDLTLMLEAGHAASLLWVNSVSGVRLGTLAPQQSLTHTVYVLPIGAGLHTVAGVRVTDVLTNRVYEFDECAQIFVR